MKGTYLVFFMQEDRTHHGMLAYEWLLHEARRLGVRGGTATKAIAGFGRHGLIHADPFIELAGDLPVQVAFMVTENEADHLLGAVAQAGMSLSYMRLPGELGLVNGPSE